MKHKITGFLLFIAYRFLQWTWRIDIIESDFVKRARNSGDLFVIAHWHGDELGILHLLKPYNVACIISTSQDGEIMNTAVQLLGAKTVRGSSTRGGTGALKGILRLKKIGRRPSVAVDGPKGPIHIVKPGVAQVARLTQLPIVPISFYSSNSHIFNKSWNKSQLPLPFSRVTIVWGPPLPAPLKRDDPKQPDYLEKIGTAIHHSRQSAKEHGTAKRGFF